jgi:hypothetical protein
MVLQILLRQINLGLFLMVAARSIVLAIFVLAATSSIMVIHTLSSPAMSTRLFGYVSLAYCCGYFCRWWLTILMTARMYVALVLWLKLKLWENFCWYFQVYGLIVFGCLHKNTRVWRYRRLACLFQTLFCNRWSQLMYLYHVLFAFINTCGINYKNPSTRLYYYLYSDFFYPRRIRLLNNDLI